MALATSENAIEFDREEHRYTGENEKAEKFGHINSAAAWRSALRTGRQIDSMYFLDIGAISANVSISNDRRLSCRSRVLMLTPPLEFYRAAGGRFRS